MATKEQYYESFSKVRAGTATKTDYDRTAAAAKQAGEMGNDARAAQAAAGITS